MSTQIASRQLVSMYELMLRIRLVEERLIDLHPEQEMRTPLHLYIGEEAIAVGVCSALQPGDSTFGTYRGHGLYVALGGSLPRMMAELYGRRDGCTKGRGGSMHMVAREQGLVGCSAIVAGTIPLATGAALAAKLEGSRRVATTFFGDGAVDEGVFYESLNFAAVKRLPVVFVCENNGYATNSRQLVRQPKDNIFERAAVWGFPGVRVDGNDVLAVHQAAAEAVARARDGEGPTLLECKTYRWKAHVGPSPDFNAGRTQQELDAWMARCPIARLRNDLLSSGLCSQAELDGMAASIEREIDDAVRFGRDSELPDPESLLNDVYCTPVGATA